MVHAFGVVVAVAVEVIMQMRQPQCVSAHYQRRHSETTTEWVLVAERVLDQRNLSLPQKAEEHAFQSGQMVVHRRGDIGVSHFRLTFQGQLPLCPFLSEIGYPACGLVPVFIHLEVRSEPTEITAGWHGPASSFAELQAH